MGVSRQLAWIILPLSAGLLGYVAYSRAADAPAIAIGGKTSSVNAATEALVGTAARNALPQSPPTNAPRAREPSVDRAAPLAVTETPEFLPRATQPSSLDASARAANATARSAPRESAARSEDELRAAMQRVSVTVYSTAWCPVCTRAKAWLRSNGVSFEERDVEKSESARSIQRSLNPKGGVPTIDVDGEVLVGFGAENMQQALRRAAERRARQF